MADVEVTAAIGAGADKVYALVSDLPRMGEWSPENTGGRWLGGASGPVVGAKFRGTNKAGFRRWSTTVTVTSADAGRRFAFEVNAYGVPISTWEYDLTAGADACVVTERWSDRRPGWMRLAAIPVTGVRDRAAHNRRTMQQTLERLKAAAES